MLSYLTLSSQLFVLTGLNRPVEHHSFGPQLLLFVCVFVFEAVGCHLKSTGAVQSALNPAGRREGGLESGEGQKKKSNPVSDTKLKSGREELGCWAVCLEFFGCLRKGKEILTPVSYTFILVVWLFSF